MKAFKTVNPNLLKDEINLFSGNNAPLSVYNSQANKNYYYCHTPPRFAYDLFDYYQQELSWYQKKMVKLFAYYVRYEYESALRKMDAIFCNSVNVQKRIKKHLGYDAEVIYPPVNVNKYYNNPSKGYYLSTARLENYKRVELIVKAFLKIPDKNLIVLSGGTLLKKLQKLSSESRNIIVVGWVDDASLLNYISECIATIYIPIDEDFGMSPVESMAAGKPVIGVAEGGVKETVVHMETGWLCPSKPSIDDIVKAVNYLSNEKSFLMRSDCEKRADKFSPHTFYTRMHELFELPEKGN
jgi:glycosyltransferase involved in cell wall biosynthesis